MYLMPDLKLPQWLLCVARSLVRVFLTHNQRGFGTRRGNVLFVRADRLGRGGLSAAWGSAGGRKPQRPLLTGVLPQILGLNALSGLIRTPG
jgi:hypothetical protein